MLRILFPGFRKRLELVAKLTGEFIIVAFIFIAVGFIGNRLYASLLDNLALTKGIGGLVEGTRPFIIDIVAMIVASVTGTLIFPKSLGIWIRLFWAALKLGGTVFILKPTFSRLSLFKRDPKLLLILVLRSAVIALIGAPLLYQLLLSVPEPHKDQELFINLLAIFVLVDAIFALYQGPEATVAGGLLAAFGLVIVGLFLSAIPGESWIYSLLHKSVHSEPFATFISDSRSLIIVFLLAAFVSLVMFLLPISLQSFDERGFLFFLPHWLRNLQFRYFVWYLLLFLVALLGILGAVTVGQRLSALEGLLFLAIMALGADVGLWIAKQYRQTQASFAGIQPYLKTMARPLTGFVGIYIITIIWFAVIFYQINHYAWGSTSPNFKEFWSSLYFSMMIITTVGSSFQVVGPVAQALTFLEAALGIAWTVILFAALTSYLNPVFQQIGRRAKAVPTIMNDGGRVRAVTRSTRLTVSKRGRGDFTSIGQAISHARKGEHTRIEVQPGHYIEPQSLVIDRPLEIVGVGPRSNISVEAIDGPCLQVAADCAITVSGLTLRDRVSNGNAYPTVDISRGKLRLQNCDIVSRSLVCIAIYGDSAKPVVEGCRIVGGQIGVLFDHGSHGKLNHCTISQSGQKGVEIAGGSDPVITTCRITDKVVGANVVDDSKGAVEYCAIYNNTWGIRIDAQGDLSIRGCRLYKHVRNAVNIKDHARGRLDSCRIYENRLSGVKIEDGGTVELRNCQIYSNGDVAIEAQTGASGRVENNFLTPNRRGSWRLDEPNQVSHCCNQPEPKESPQNKLGKSG